MRTRAITTILITTGLALATAACGGDDGDSHKAAGKPAANKTFDCSDAGMSQADWTRHCSDETGAAKAGEEKPALAFGSTYTWPDGLKVSVTEAAVFTDFTEDEGAPDPDETEFRVKLRLTNGGAQPVELDDLSTIIEGATNGGEAASSEFSNGSEPLEGRLAPGVTAVKTDDSTLGKKYGRKIVVRVQRSSDGEPLEFPEFTGAIQ